MDIIPAIDIRGGRCVRLVQGDYARETVFDDDPVAVAQRWVSMGARRIHVVDLDGAKERRPVNDGIIRRIIETTGVAIQVAGGMGDASIIRKWRDDGADRVVVGTLAVEQPDAMQQLLEEMAGSIAIAVDARGGKAATKGWLETSDTTVDAFIRGMAARGARHFIYTDISRDGMMQSIDAANLAPIIEAARTAQADAGAPAPLIYSGGVTSIDDIIALAEQEIEGVIIGRALYDGSIDLREAQRALVMGDDW